MYPSKAKSKECPFLPAQLILSSGETFPGFAPQWQEGVYFGETVFATGMTGYVESLTDPSYAGQILTFTYPLIGNYGVPGPEKWESGCIQAAGVVTGHVSAVASHWDSEKSFLAWLQEYKIPLITGVDTRELTKRLRKSGVALGAIVVSGGKPHKFQNPNDTHLVAKVSLPQREVLKRGKKKVIAVDCGMKQNIARCLSEFDVELIRVPYNYDYTREEFDGLFLSNGPGDPTMCKETITILQKALKLKRPVFGICLGAQILALAIGSKTYKLKFGHRGQNHPCMDLREKKCLLTSQNHGYAIDEKSLPKDWKVMFRSLNDNSVEGIEHRTLPYFAVQFHPEAHPGPTDANYLFKKFYESM
ncbi:MAG: glutamine-hydrolyzing carbamoyl-phosphate synthase small subunit [Verrucomicrobiota bacterium]|nr:glutamine-hydrolyzing carbamoyl-phosphate synthase small subunit [Verrucomicrobiota bacterium]